MIPESSRPTETLSKIANPPKRVKACMNCRILKIKCDGGRPICGPCQAHPRDDSCEYSDVEKSRAKVLEDTVLQLEARPEALESAEPSVMFKIQRTRGRRLLCFKFNVGILSINVSDCPGICGSPASPSSYTLPTSGLPSGLSDTSTPPVRRPTNPPLFVDEPSLQDRSMLERTHHLCTTSTQMLSGFSIQAVRWLYFLPFLGFINLYELKYRYKPDHTPPTKVQQWTQITTTMTSYWETIYKIALFILPTTFTLLQISQIVDNPLARMTTVMAAISSAGSAITGCLYTKEKAHWLEDDFLMTRWLEASEHPNRITSVDFWACLAVPMSFLLWSIIFFVVTIGIFVWAYPCNICTSNSWITTPAILITLLALISVLFIFRACKLLRYI